MNIGFWNLQYVANIKHSVGTTHVQFAQEVLGFPLHVVIQGL